MSHVWDRRNDDRLRRLVAEGLDDRVLAARFGVGRAAVRDARLRLGIKAAVMGTHERCPVGSLTAAGLQASAAFDRWRLATTRGLPIAARLAAADLLDLLAAGVAPEWTAGERASLEAWCGAGGNAPRRGVDGVPLRPDAQGRVTGLQGWCKRPETAQRM